MPSILDVIRFPFTWDSSITKSNWECEKPIIFIVGNRISKRKFLVTWKIFFHESQRQNKQKWIDYNSITIDAHWRARQMNKKQISINSKSTSKKIEFYVQQFSCTLCFLWVSNSSGMKSRGNDLLENNETRYCDECAAALTTKSAHFCSAKCEGFFRSPFVLFLCACSHRLCAVSQ